MRGRSSLGVRRVSRGRHDSIVSAVWILLHHRGVLAHDHTAAKATVERGLVQNQRVLNVVAAVAHDGDGGVLAGWHAMEVDEFDGFALHHGTLGIHEQVEQGVLQG